MDDDPIFKVYVLHDCFKIVIRSKSMMGLAGQQRNDPNATKYAKPFLSIADEIGQDDFIQMPSKKTCLVIERNNLCNIYAKEPAQDEFSRSQQILQTFDCYGILGIVNIQGFNFLATVTNRGTEPAASLTEGVNIFEVEQVSLTGFSKNMNLESNPKLAMQVEYFERLFNRKEEQTQGFYFSYHADLSMS